MYIHATYTKSIHTYIMFLSVVYFCRVGRFAPFATQEIIINFLVLFLFRGWRISHIAKWFNKVCQLSHGPTMRVLKHRLINALYNYIGK